MLRVPCRFLLFVRHLLKFFPTFSSQFLRTLREFLNFYLEIKVTSIDLRRKSTENAKNIKFLLYLGCLVRKINISSKIAWASKVHGKTLTTNFPNFVKISLGIFPKWGCCESYRAINPQAILKIAENFGEKDFQSGVVFRWSIFAS